MFKFANVIDENTKLCSVGLGTDAEFYQSIGMTEQEVEQAYDGGWYLKGYAPEKPQPTKEQLANEARRHRDHLLTSTDWLLVRHNEEKELKLETTLSAQEFTELMQYRQMLRDITKQSDFPYVVDWGVNPIR